MSVNNLVSDVISLPAAGTPVLVNRTRWQPAIQVANPSEQVLVSSRYQSVPIVVPVGSTAANFALTDTNNVLLPASQLRRVLLTRILIRDIAYVQNVGTATDLLIGKPADSSVSPTAILSPAAFALNANATTVLSIVSVGVQAGVNTIVNRIDAAAGQVAELRIGLQEYVALAAADTTGANRVSPRLAFAPNAVALGQGPITLALTPRTAGTTDSKSASFTVDLFGYVLPPI